MPAPASPGSPNVISLELFRKRSVLAARERALNDAWNGLEDAVAPLPVAEIAFGRTVTHVVFDAQEHHWAGVIEVPGNDEKGVGRLVDRAMVRGQIDTARLSAVLGRSIVTEADMVVARELITRDVIDQVIYGYCVTVVTEGLLPSSKPGSRHRPLTSSRTHTAYRPPTDLADYDDNTRYSPPEVERRVAVARWAADAITGSPDVALSASHKNMAGLAIGSATA